MTILNEDRLIYCQYLKEKALSQIQGEGYVRPKKTREVYHKQELPGATRSWRGERGSCGLCPSLTSWVLRTLCN